MSSPSRPLGPAGLDAWHRLAPPDGMPAGALLGELVLLVCEQIDEREQLRQTVAEGGHWRDRAALRAIEAQITSTLTAVSDRSDFLEAAPNPWDDLLAKLGGPE